MPPRRSARTKQPGTPAAASNTSNIDAGASMVDAEQSEDALYDVPDSLASSPVRSIKRKRRNSGATVATPSRSSRTDSVMLEDSHGLETPATSLDDVEDELGIDSKAHSVVDSVRSTKQSSFKEESESELSELDDLIDSFEDNQSSAPATKKRFKSKGANMRHAISATLVERDTNLLDSEDEDYEDAAYIEESGDDLPLVAHPGEDENEDDLEGSAEEVPSRPRSRRAPRIRRSKYQTTAAQLREHHPDLDNVWGALEAAVVTTRPKAAQPDILTLKLLPFQLEGLHWLRTQEISEFRGGILADEMGMGKTIQTVAMLVTDTSRDKNGGEAGTLVVAPTVALMQWKSEIAIYTNNALNVLIYHGNNRETSAEKLKEYDIILTTYNLLESVWRKQQSGFRRKVGVVKEKSLIHSIMFHRIVLDEAHNIKDRSCGTARAVFNLQGSRRWCLSGTPLQNRVGELFSLLRFLQADPFPYYYCKKCPCKSLHWRFTNRKTCDGCNHSPMSHTCWFNHELLNPIQKFGAEGEGLDAFKKIHLLLRKLMLRRTKVERADDMGLPPRVVTIRKDLFNDEEEDLYESLYTASKRKFNTYADEGTVLNNYANIFQLITRMRQMADHPDLILRRTAEPGQNSLVCKICDDTSEDAVKAKCHHIFCRSCVKDYQEGYSGAVPDCPVCHVALNIDLTAPALETANHDLIKRNSILNRIDMSKWRSSTKIEALVEELYKLRSKDSSIKSIVFSQWTSFLELVNWRLRRAGFNCCKLDGTMTPEARANTINHFSTDPSVSVFLVSLKAGGVALNLTEASVVFLSDPWWNPSAEWQAADRVHRLGQHRPVRITRLVIENSIESRIVELQEKKANMISSTIDGDANSLNRLSVADMSFLFQS